MSTTYEPVDLEEMQKEAERNSQEGNNTSDFLEKFVKLPAKEGYVLMRFLPRRQKGKQLYCATRTHRLNNKNYHCPRELVMTANGRWQWQGQCVVCEYCADLWKKSEKLNGKPQEDLQNKYRQIKAIERFYYNVIVREERNEDGEIKRNVGPKIYPCGKTVHAKIVTAFNGDKTSGKKGLGDITDPKKGRDFRLVKKLKKSGKSEWADYDLSDFEDVSPTGTPDEFDKWMGNLHDLHALRIVKPNEELKEALKRHLGLIPDGSSSFDPSEFEITGESATEERVTEPVVIVTAKKPTAKVESDDMPDDDFLKNLDALDA
jgi:hypothetical protein